MANPRTWLLLGRKAGDNTQVRALGASLGWQCEEKQVLAQPWELLTHLTLGATLAGIDRRASSELAAPWPDLVISAGRRNEPVARWIRQQSGGRTRLVHLGRPWAHPDHYDLVITTPQYFLPDSGSILHNQLPLHDLRRADLQQDAASLQAQLSNLPAPYTALLVGGDSGPFVFTPDKARSLAQQTQALAQDTGGSLLITNSARTPEAAWQALQQAITMPHFCYSAGEAGGNPYRGMLGLADQFVVTGESMSMIGEALAMQRPVHLFDLSDRSGAWWRHGHNWRYKPVSHHLAMGLAPRRMRRDISRIQNALVDGGLAQWLGDSTTQASVECVANVSELELAESANRVKALMQLS